MYNLNKDYPEEDDIIQAQTEWEQEKKNILEQNEYLSSFSKESDRDLTLLLSVDDIKSKINTLYGLQFHDNMWIYHNFKDAIVACKVLSKNLTFQEFASTKYPMYSWLSSVPKDTVEVKFLSGVKFDILKTLEIMKNLFAEFQLWVEYKGDNNND